MTAFMRTIEERFSVPVPDYAALHRFSIERHADFWQTWDQPVLDFLVERCLRGGVSCKSMTDDKLASMGFTAPLAAAAAAPTTAPTAVASPTAAHTMAHT